MVNICFGNSIYAVLRSHFLDSEQVFCFQDDLSIGYLDVDHLNLRYDSIGRYLGISEKDFISNYEELAHIRERSPEITIWTSICPYEYCGMLYVMWLFRDAANIYVIHCPGEIDGEETIGCGEIQFKDIPYVASLKEKVDGALRDRLVDEWRQLAAGENLRLFIDHKIIEAEPGYLDAIISGYAEMGKNDHEILGYTLCELRDKHKITFNANYIQDRIALMRQR